MIGSAELRSGVIGAGILLSAIGFGSADASAAEPVQGAGQPAATAQLNPGGMLDRASGVERFSGALKGVQPPVLDGPVAWGGGMSPLQSGLMVGALGGLLGALAGSTMSDRYRSDTGKVLLGAAIGFGVPVGIGALAEPSRVVEFSTIIQEVQRDDPPHYERRQTGKTTTTQGPYYSQIVSIPECAIPLATNSYKVPLIPGQKVIAKFNLDAENHIISWRAKPAVRE